MKSVLPILKSSMKILFDSDSHKEPCRSYRRRFRSSGCTCSKKSELKGQHSISDTESKAYSQCMRCFNRHLTNTHLHSSCPPCKESFTVPEPVNIYWNTGLVYRACNCSDKFHQSDEEVHNLIWHGDSSYN